MASGKQAYTTYVSESPYAVGYGTRYNSTPSKQKYAKMCFGSVIGDVASIINNDYAVFFTQDISKFFKLGFNFASRTPISKYWVSSGNRRTISPYVSTYYGNDFIISDIPQSTNENYKVVYTGDWVLPSNMSKLAFLVQCAVQYDDYTNYPTNPRSVCWKIIPMNYEYNVPYYFNVGGSGQGGLTNPWVLVPDGLPYSNETISTSYPVESTIWSSTFGYKGTGTLSLSKDPVTNKYVEVIPDFYLCIDSDNTLYCVLDKRNSSLNETASVWDVPDGSADLIPGSRLDRYCVIRLKTRRNVRATSRDNSGNVVISNSVAPDEIDFISKVNDLFSDSPSWSDYPYDPTPPHGGDGEQDFSSDDIPNPTIPAWSAVACGLCKAYSPTLTEVQAMAGELWSSDFVDSMKKLYNDPMEAVISFGTIPVKPNTADATTPLVVGNYTFTSASARPVTSNFVTVDCGEVTLPKQYDGFQDYEPYTKIQIYLPFIGNQTVTPSDVVGKPAHLYYRIDVLTGACLAWLSVENRVLYQWTGNCFTEIPLSKNSKSQIYSQIIHGIVNTITSSAQGGVAGGAVGAALGGVSGIISTITDVATSKHSDVMRTGALNPASSTLGVRTPYFIISYPTMVTPEGYASAKGIPVNAGGTIGEFSGYTVVDSVHLENIAATENELREIESLLTGGVIL